MHTRHKAAILVSCFITLVGVAAILWAAAPRSVGPVARAASGQVDLVAVDLDTGGNDDANIGTIQNCAELAAVNDVLTFDLVAKGVDATDTIASYQFDIDYDPNIIAIDSFIDVDSRGSTSPNDVSMISRINSSGGAGFLSLSDVATNPSSLTVAAADGTGDAFFHVAGTQAPPQMHEPGSITNAVDDDFDGMVDNSTESSQDGVLARITVHAVGMGISPLTIPSSLGGADLNPDAVVSAGAGAYAGQPLPIASLQGGSIAVGASCPSQADVAVASVTTSAPASGMAGASFNVTANVSLANNGPEDPLNLDASIALSLLADCTTSSPNPISIQDTLVTVAGSPLALPQQSWTVTCSDPGNHTFTTTAAATIDQPGMTDTNPGNNSATSAAAITALSAESDFKIASVNVTAPAEETVDTAFLVTATANVHNNGPFEPARAIIVISLTLPANCTTPHTAQYSFVPPLPVSVAATVPQPAASWELRCNAAQLETFQVTATISPNQQNLTDPTPANNTASDSATTNMLVGVCGPDPTPDTETLQNPSPTLLFLVTQLTGLTGNTVPDGQEYQLQCDYDLNFDDDKGAPIDDCEVSLPLEEHPCSVTVEVGIDDPAGSPSGEPSVQLNPIGVFFVSPNLEFATDLEVPNGSTSGWADFRIRTDGSLARCVADIVFPPVTAFEGGILPNVPESNSSTDLGNPNVWPNDLNGEVDAVETAFQAATQHPRPIEAQTRHIAPLSVAGVNILMNIIVFKIVDPAIATATGAEWVIVGSRATP